MTKKITIVGVGALGSHVIQFIRNEDANIVSIDFDRIEQKNVLSQFHSKPSVGKNKAQSIQQTMNFLFGTKIEALPRKLQKDNVDALLKNSDLVVDCLDNFEARTLVQNYVRANKIPCVHGALAAGGVYGQVVWDENFTIDSEVGQGAATCEDGEHLAFIGVVSAYLAKAVHEFVNNNKKLGFQINPAGTIQT